MPDSLEILRDLRYTEQSVSNSLVRCIRGAAVIQLVDGRKRRNLLSFGGGQLSKLITESITAALQEKIEKGVTSAFQNKISEDGMDALGIIAKKNERHVFGHAVDGLRNHLYSGSETCGSWIYRRNEIFNHAEIGEVTALFWSTSYNSTSRALPLLYRLHPLGGITEDE